MCTMIKMTLMRMMKLTRTKKKQTSIRIKRHCKGENSKNWRTVNINPRQRENERRLEITDRPIRGKIQVIKALKWEPIKRKIITIQRKDKK